MVLASAQRHGLLLCRDDPSVPFYARRAEHGDGHGGVYDRQGRLACSDFHFRASEPLTVFSFSRPNWAAQLDTFPQHTLLFFHYVPERLRPCYDGELEVEDAGDSIADPKGQAATVPYDVDHMPKWRHAQCLGEGSLGHQWYVDNANGRQRAGIWDMTARRYGTAHGRPSSVRRLAQHLWL